MPHKNHDLHGSAPDSADTALLLIDVINDLEFDGGKGMLQQALQMAENVLALKKRARRAGVPIIYVNDNFGRWQSNFNRLIAHCIDDNTVGRPLVELLCPDDDSDYFVLKPKHSGFFSTTLDTLLEYLNVRTLILTGIAGNICVLFTANDAYMRDFDLRVPCDCVVSNTPEENNHALEQMHKVLKADIRKSSTIRFRRKRRK